MKFARPLVVAAVALGALGAAQAHTNVSLSIGLGTPVVTYPAPVYVAPAPVAVYTPPPPPVYYAPAYSPVYYYTPAYAPGPGVMVFHGRYWHRHHRHHHFDD